MTSPAQRRRRRSDEILASAVAAFRQHGYHGTSTRQIADALQLTKGSLYYYFESKAEILYAAHARALRRMLVALERIEASGADPETQLRELVVEHVRALVDGFHGTALGLEIDALPPPLRRRVLAGRDRFERGLRRILERGAASGAFRPLDARLTGFALLGAINWTARWYRPDGGTDPEVLGRFYADVFVQGLRAAPTRHRMTPRPRPKVLAAGG